MADWSQLPPELLPLIGKCLRARFDVIRFRSVCSSWRSSVPPKVYPYPFPRYLPSKTIGRCEHSLRNITRNTFYLIKSSHGNQTQPPACWLVKISDASHGVKLRMLNPLTDSELKLTPDNFPMVLDLNNFQVIELGHEYIAQHEVDIDHPLEPQTRDYMDKVVCLQSSIDTDGFTMLAFIHYLPNRLAFLRWGEKDWTLLETEQKVRDIISFNGKIYAMERKGRTIVVDQSLNVSFLELVGSSSSIMFLVKCVDNLLAVEMLLSTYTESRMRYHRLVGEKVVGFKVFLMNEEEQRWDEMESLRDRILILGFHQAISAPAFEFGWGRGNLIFFSESVLVSGSEDRRMLVFDLETGTASPLENCPAYCNLFGPPPQWVASCSTQVITNSVHSVTSTSLQTGDEFTNISTTASSAGKEVESEHPSPMSKCSFKFCCF